MLSLRETEIRASSCELVVDAYRIINLLPAAVPDDKRHRMLDAAFKISSGVANAMISLRQAQSYKELNKALRAVKLLKSDISSNLGNANGTEKDYIRFSGKLEAMEQDINELIFNLNLISTEVISPKLERACI